MAGNETNDKAGDKMAEKSEAASHWKQPHTTTFYFSRW